MKNIWGIIGYMLLVISATFLNAPIFSLLAMPLFLLGAAFFIRFYLSIVKKGMPNKQISNKLILTGSILVTLLIGYSAIEFTSYLDAIYQSEFNSFANKQPAVQVPIQLHKIIIVAALNFVFSLMIFVGCRLGSSLSIKKLLLLVTPTLLIIPITILLMKLLNSLGFPLLG
jgi:hypothetical protein